MSSKLALLLPIISLIYLLQTLFRRQLKTYLKFSFAVISLAVLVFDVFAYLMFSVNCIEMGLRYNTEFDCIRWIYPTLDFTIMVVLSLLALAFAFLGVARGWNRKINYTLGSLVLFVGVISRLFVLIEATDAISLTHGSSNYLIFEIFSIIIVYGLISSVIYFVILLLGIITARIPQ
jgi:hypothetical protein